MACGKGAADVPGEVSAQPAQDVLTHANVVSEPSSEYEGMVEMAFRHEN